MEHPVKGTENILIPAPPPVVTREAEGTLVYYCPERMLENSHNNISVTITKAALKDAIDQLNKKVEATTGKSGMAIHTDPVSYNRIFLWEKTREKIVVN
ncbi:MAG: hypothetical protein M1445_14160 [Bacteroidetes bacterium]|nr:hypothetical protein [Bacteroidota bacterium]